MARRRCRLGNNSTVMSACQPREGWRGRGGREGGKRRRREKRGERGQLVCLCLLQNHHPKTLIYLIGVVGKIYNALVSHCSHAKLFPITTAHEINCTGILQVHNKSCFQLQVWLNGCISLEDSVLSVVPLPPKHHMWLSRVKIPLRVTL